MVVPAAVRGQHIIIGAQRDRMPVDDGIGALAFHDEAVRGGGVLVRGGNLAGAHRLHAAEQPAADRDIRAPLAAVVEQGRSEEHTSELQSLMRTSYAVFCLNKKN